MSTMEQRIEQTITDLDISNIENGLIITDLDIRVLEMEVAQNDKV